MSFGNPQQSGQSTVFKGGYRVQTSTFKGLVIVEGTQRIAGNILAFFDFTVVPHQSSGKGFGSGATTNTYSERILTGLCQGTINGIGRVWKGSGASTLLPARVVAVRYDLATGALGQAIQSYIASAHPGYALGYSGIAYAWTPNLEDLGTSTQPPQFNWEVSGLNVIAPGVTLDANPANIITDVLDNEQWALGTIWQSAWTGDMAPDYFLANQLLLSIVIDTEKEAQAILKQIADITGGDFRWSGSLYQFVPYGDQIVTANGATWTPDLTPVYNFGDDDYSPDKSDDAPVLVTVKDNYSDKFNRSGIEFLNRANNYDPETIYRELQDDIQNVGLRTDSVFQAHEVCDPLVATLVAQLRLTRQFTVTNEYKFKVDGRYFLLDALDIVSLTDTKTGLDLYPVRIVSIGESAKDYKLDITAEDLGVTTPSLYPTQARNAQTNSGGGNVPVPINAPIIFEPTVPLANLAHGIGEIWFAVSGQNGNESWGGYYLYVSADGGTTYELVSGETSAGANVLQGAATMGTLISTLPKSATDPDSTNTLAVDLSESNGTLVSLSDANAKAYQNLCYVDGEFITFATQAAGTYSNQFNLTYLYRHLFKTKNVAHSAGTSFTYLGSPTNIDGGIFRWKVPRKYIGQTLYFQFCSFNEQTQEVQPLGQGSIYTYTPSGIGVKSSGANLIPDSSLLSPSTFWIGGSTAMVWAAAAGINNANAFVYTGTGSAAGANTNKPSSVVPVNPGDTLCVSDNIDATNVTSGSPRILVQDPALSVIYCEADQTAGVAGLVSNWFTVPNCLSVGTQTFGSTINVDSTTGDGFNQPAFPAAGTIVIGGQLVAYTGTTSTSFTGCTGGSGSIPAGTVVGINQVVVVKDMNGATGASGMPVAFSPAQLEYGQDPTEYDTLNSASGYGVNSITLGMNVSTPSGSFALITSIPVVSPISDGSLVTLVTGANGGGALASQAVSIRWKGHTSGLTYSQRAATVDSGGGLNDSITVFAPAADDMLDVYIQQNTGGAAAWLTGSEFGVVQQS